MDSWTSISKDSLVAAKLLLSNGHIRSCVSRSYYAAYAGGTAALLAGGVNMGDRVRPNPTHSQLPKLLKHNLDPVRFQLAERTDLSRRVRNLRRFREMAEYDAEATISNCDALQCVRDASVVLAKTGS